MDRVALRLSAFLVVVSLAGFASSSWAVVTPWPSSFKGATFSSSVTGGSVAIEAPFSVWPAVADGAGGAKFAGKQVLRLPGASAELGLSRLVTVANLARGARIAASFGSIIGLAGLAYEGITWAVDHFEVPAADGPVPGMLWGATLVDGSSNAAVWGQLSTCRIAAPCAYSDFESRVVARCNAVAVSTGAGRYCDGLVVTAVGESFRWTQTMRLSNGGYIGLFVVEGDDAGVNPIPPAGSPATDAQVESSLSAALVADPSKAPGVLEWVKESVPLLNLNPEPLAVSGPSTVSGPTVTNVTVTDAGTKTENRTTNFNLTYNTGNVTVTQTTTTTVTNPDNSQSTSTETTSAGSGGGSEAPLEPSDVCKDHPQASGCAELGEHDPEPDLGQESRALSWVPTLNAAGSCPAPQPFTVHGQSFQMDWSYVCDLATGLRPVVLAVAWLSAAVFVFGVSRGTV